MKEHKWRFAIFDSKTGEKLDSGSFVLMTMPEVLIELHNMIEPGKTEAVAFSDDEHWIATTRTDPGEPLVTIDRVHTAAAEGFDAGYDRGFDAGYDDGFDDGFDAGYDECI